MASLEKQVSNLTRENLQLKNTIMYFFVHKATTKAGSNSSDSISRKWKNKNKRKKPRSKIIKNKKNDSYTSCSLFFSYHSILCIRTYDLKSKYTISFIDFSHFNHFSYVSDKLQFFIMFPLNFRKLLPS